MSGTLRNGLQGPPIQLQREQLVLKLEEIRSLLSKADARLREDPENRRRWLSVIENLENSLTETKARLEHVELAIQRGNTAAEPETERNVGGGLSDSGIRYVDNVLRMSVLEVSSLSLEDLSRTQAHAETPGLHPEQRARVASKIELANQLRSTADEAGDADLPSRRAQLILRGAIDKIQAGRIMAMSSDEVQVLSACHELLIRRVNPSPADQRLKRIVGGALNLLQRRQSEALAR